MLIIDGYIVDFTLSEDGKFKILELGDLSVSGTQGFDTLHPDDTVSMRYDQILRSRLGEKAYKITITAGSCATFRVSSFDPETRSALEKLDLGHADCHVSDLINLLVALSGLTSTHKVLIKLDNELLKRAHANDDFSAFVHWCKTQESNSNFLFLCNSRTFHNACTDKGFLHKYLDGSAIYPETFHGVLSALSISAIKEFLKATQYDLIWQHISGHKININYELVRIPVVTNSH